MDLISNNELLVEIKDYICTITINRPQRRNALNADVLTSLGDTLNSFKERKDVRAVILRGAGDEAFSAGMDLLSTREGGEGDRRKSAIPYARESILTCPCPIIAMVFGYVAGAGCDLAVTCDFRIAAENAQFAMPPVKLGLVYDYKAIQRFINLIGLGYTKELFLTAKFVDARKAQEMGLVNHIVPKEDLITFTLSFAKEMIGNAPLAMAGTKMAIAKLLAYQNLPPQADAEIQAITEKCWQSEDAKEARKAFAEKRKPIFKGI